MARRKTDAEFKSEVKALVEDEYLVLGHYEGCNTKIEFRHKKCGLKFKMRPRAFLDGQRCPSCMFQISHAKTKKEPAKFKNEFYRISGEGYILVSNYQTSRKNIIVLHVKCGLLYRVQPNNFLHGQRCPHCNKKSLRSSNKKSLRSSNEEFRAKVNRLGGQNYIPLQRYKNSKTKVLMLHKTCGSKYYVRPNDFISGSRCPVCRYANMAKKRTIKFQEIKERVHKITGGEYKVFPKGYRNTHTKILFLHLDCGRLFLMTPHSFFEGQRCPLCRESKGERAVREYLQAKNIKFQSQFKIKKCKDKRKLPFDFAVFNTDKTLNCLIEYQGEQHFYDPFEWKHATSMFDLQSVLNTQKHDAMKLQYCKDHGIKLIRINHPQTSRKSNSIEFIERLVNQTLNKELHVV